MAATSFDGAVRWMGHRRWKLLHKTGMYTSSSSRSYAPRALVSRLVLLFVCRSSRWRCASPSTCGSAAVGPPRRRISAPVAVPPRGVRYLQPPGRKGDAHMKYLRTSLRLLGAGAALLGEGAAAAPRQTYAAYVKGANTTLENSPRRAKRLRGDQPTPEEPRLPSFTPLADVKNLTPKGGRARCNTRAGGGRH